MVIAVATVKLCTTKMESRRKTEKKRELLSKLEMRAEIEENCGEK